MALQLTALTTIIGIITMLGAWRFVTQRLRQNPAPTSRPVQLLSRFFLYMGIFFLLMSLPAASLFFAPDQFPLLMALGYVSGHVFLYIALLHVALMTCSMIPRLSSRGRLITILWSLAIVVVTVVNAVTMIFGARPFYDYERHLTAVNAAPPVGISIAIFATLALLPAAVLFIINAVKTQGARRTRSILLAVGFLLQMSAGPLHDVARTWQLYMTADILTIVSVILVGIGAAYRLEQNLAPDRPVASSAPAVTAA